MRLTIVRQIPQWPYSGGNFVGLSVIVVDVVWYPPDPRSLASTDFVWVCAGNGIMASPMWAFQTLTLSRLSTCVLVVQVPLVW